MLLVLNTGSSSARVFVAIFIFQRGVCCRFFQEMGSHAQLATFKALVQAAAPQAASQTSSKFMKKMDEIPSLELSPTNPCQKSLILSEQALIAKFTGLWPRPKAVELWIVEHWNPLLQG